MFQDPTQAQALANATRSQMPPLTPMAKKYAANVLQVARQRTDLLHGYAGDIVHLPAGYYIAKVQP